MKLRELKIRNYRSIQSIDIAFDDQLTVVVGENDAGKSSLVDCIRVVTQGRGVDAADFTYGKTEMSLVMAVDDMEFLKQYELKDGRVEEKEMKARPTKGFVAKVSSWLESPDRDFDDPPQLEELKEKCRLFGIPVRSNSNPGTLKGSLKAALEAASNPDFVIEGARFPSFNSIQLDGKHFENVPAFFKEVYLKEKQKSLWSTPVADKKTILDVVNDAIDHYSEEMNRKLDETGVKNKLRLFLPTLTDVIVEPDYAPQEFNLNANVIFLENGNRIDLNKKGDGTKRRITMALLELKRDAAAVGADQSTVYLLDEPDTHLHVRAQIQLLETLLDFARKGNQVIISTHSPFILNTVNPGQVRLLISRENNRTELKNLSDTPKSDEEALRALGIENVYLFFARTIVLVEGETEENFLHSVIPRILGKSPASNLIKIVSVAGIENIYGFSRALSEVHSPERIFVLNDNEQSDEMKDLIGRLAVPAGNRFVVGTKEFEDAFEPAVIHSAWERHIQERGKANPPEWNVTQIAALRDACRPDPGRKYSKELKQLNAKSGVKMSKPILGRVLGKNVDLKDIPQPISELIRKI